MSKLTPEEQAALENQAAAAKMSSAMGFCPECAADYQSGFEHALDCGVSDRPEYAVRAKAPAATAPVLELVRVGKGRAHLRAVTASRAICGEPIVGILTFRNTAWAAREVTCTGCRITHRLPRLPERGRPKR